MTTKHPLGSEIDSAIRQMSLEAFNESTLKNNYFFIINIKTLRFIFIISPKTLIVATWKLYSRLLKC
jgi:hypothetical protein